MSPNQDVLVRNLLKQWGVTVDTQLLDQEADHILIHKGRNVGAHVLLTFETTMFSLVSVGAVISPNFIHSFFLQIVIAFGVGMRSVQCVCGISQSCSELI